jgi:hypothetical protein
MLILRAIFSLPPKLRAKIILPYRPAIASPISTQPPNLARALVVTQDHSQHSLQTVPKHLTCEQKPVLASEIFLEHLVRHTYPHPLNTYLRTATLWFPFFPPTNTNAGVVPCHLFHFVSLARLFHQPLLPGRCEGCALRSPILSHTLSPILDTRCHPYDSAPVFRI